MVKQVLKFSLKTISTLLLISLMACMPAANYYYNAGNERLRKNDELDVAVLNIRSRMKKYDNKDQTVRGLTAGQIVAEQFLDNPDMTEEQIIALDNARKDGLKIVPVNLNKFSEKAKKRILAIQKRNEKTDAYHVAVNVFAILTDLPRNDLLKVKGLGITGRPYEYVGLYSIPEISAFQKGTAIHDITDVLDDAFKQLKKSKDEKGEHFKVPPSFNKSVYGTESSEFSAVVMVIRALPEILYDNTIDYLF